MQLLVCRGCTSVEVGMTATAAVDEEEDDDCLVGSDEETEEEEATAEACCVRGRLSAATDAEMHAD